MFCVGRPRLYTTKAVRQQAYRQWKRKAKQSALKVYHRSLSVEWEMPQDDFDRLHAEFGFTLDVCAKPENAKCARYYTPEQEGILDTNFGTWGLANSIRGLMAQPERGKR